MRQHTYNYLGSLIKMNLSFHYDSIMIAPPFNTWLDTNLGTIKVLKFSPNGMQELKDFLEGGRRNFEDYEFYVTEEEIHALILQPSKYLECYSSDITTWKRISV
jgi:hypothetical protein